MNIDEFNTLRLGEETPDGDRRKLLLAAKVMLANELTPFRFAALHQDELEQLIRHYVASLPKHVKKPASMRSPRTLARAMLFAMARLFKGIADAPAVAVPIPKRVVPMPESARPAAIAAYVATWTPKIIGNVAAGGTGKPITLDRKAKIEANFWQFMTLCDRMEMPLGNQTSFVVVTSLAALETVLPEIKAAFGERSRPSWLSAIKQMVAGLLSDTHPNTLAWATNVKALGVGNELPLEQIEELRNLTSVSAAFTVWDVPDRIAAAARHQDQSVVARDRLLACAFATALALDVLSITPEGLAELNLDAEIVGVGVNRVLRHQMNGAEVDLPLSEATLAFHDEQTDWRTASRRTSAWLFPDRSGKRPKRVSSTITYLATAIEVALQRRHTTVDLQDAVAINAIDMGQVEATELSDARAVAHVKSTRTRYRLAFENPLGGC